MLHKHTNRREAVTKCCLIEPQSPYIAGEYSYSACAFSRDAYKDEEEKGIFRYIGKGFIVSINGVISKDLSIYFFWNKVTR